MSVISNMLDYVCSKGRVESKRVRRKSISQGGSDDKGGLATNAVDIRRKLE